MIFIIIIFIFLLLLIILRYLNESFVTFPSFSFLFTIFYSYFFINLFVFISLLFYLSRYRYNLGLFKLVLSFSTFGIIIVKLSSFYDEVLNYVLILGLTFFEERSCFSLILITCV